MQLRTQPDTSGHRIYGFLAIAALLLSGCTNLDAVSNFAKLSASITNYEQVVHDYAQSPKRQMLYQPDNQDAMLHATAKRRAEQSRHFAAAQATLVAYMETLGDLASDHVATIDDDIDNINTALATTKFIGDGDRSQNIETASAAGAIATIVGNAILDRWRKDKVVEIIQSANPNLQVAIAGFTAVLDIDLRESLNNEKAAIKKPFRAWQAAARAASDPDGAPVIANMLMEERVRELETKETKLDDYIKALHTIRKGHQDLFDNVGKLDQNAIIGLITGYSKEIQRLRKPFYASIRLN